MVRWLVDRNLRKKLAHHNLTEEELTAEGNKSPGVLLASGYIADGAIAGIVIAFLTELASDFSRTGADPHRPGKELSADSLPDFWSRLNVTGHLPPSRSLGERS